jgi:uncharacterized protein GlcG (DUF336 family)
LDMKLIQLLTIGVAAVVLPGIAGAQGQGQAQQQGLPAQKLLTLDMAQTIAQAALAKCRADGFKVTVTVVDASNAVKVVLRDDGATIASAEVGRMKASTVIIFGRPSFPPWLPDLPALSDVPRPNLPGTINERGGLPIKVGDQIIGAVSIAGPPDGHEDVACSAAGIAKVADQLK